MGSKGTLRPFPSFRTDEEAERFVDQADLTDYDLSGFKPASFELGTAPSVDKSSPDASRHEMGPT